MDLDFASFTINCLEKNTTIYLRDPTGAHQIVTANFFDLRYDVKGTLELEPGWMILSENYEWTPLVRSWRRMETSKILHFKTATTDLRVTENHRIPIIRDGQRIELLAKDIRVGDEFIKVSFTSVLEQNASTRITITEILEEPYNDYVYDFETGNHYFVADGIVVHNCIHIPLDKLLKDGYSTGHGFLRSPSNIRTAAALTCIAIQASQNDFLTR